MGLVRFMGVRGIIWIFFRIASGRRFRGFSRALIVHLWPMVSQAQARLFQYLGKESSRKD